MINVEILYSGSFKLSDKAQITYYDNNKDIPCPKIGESFYERRHIQYQEAHPKYTVKEINSEK